MSLYNAELEIIDPGEYRFTAVPEPRPATYQCVICGHKEDPEATIVYAFAWFCPKCQEKLRKLLAQQGDE